MDGLTFLKSLDADDPMPMARPWRLRIVSVARGAVQAIAMPSHEHENPFGVVQGGFAATVLDIALGLVSISVLEDAAKTMVATTDLLVRYFKAIEGSTGELLIEARVTHHQERQIVAEAYLQDAAGARFAYAQSNCIIARRPQPSA